MKNKKGFTLVEVLASIVILGILLMIAVPSVSKLQEASNIKQIESDAKIFVELVRQKIERDTSITIDATNDEFKLSSIDVTKLSSNKYKDTSYVKVSSCDYQGSTDIYTCTNFDVMLENDNYKSTGTVNGDTVSISGAKK